MASRRPAPHGGQQGGALHQLVAGQGVEAALGRARPAVVGAADPLEEGGDAARRADLAHQLDRADVDAELERGGGHQGPQLAGPQARLDPVAAVLGQAAVVGGDHVVAEALAELMGEPLGQPPGVDEHQRGAVLGRPGRRCGRARPTICSADATASSSPSGSSRPRSTSR